MMPRKRSQRLVSAIAPIRRTIRSRSSPAERALLVVHKNDSRYINNRHQLAQLFGTAIDAEVEQRTHVGHSRRVKLDAAALALIAEVLGSEPVDIEV